MKTTAFAEWLAQTRERRGLSQNQLALTAGVDPSTVNKLEAGQIELPRKSTLRKLSAPLQVTEAEIFRAAGLRSETPTVERELSDEEWGLVELYRGVSPERRELYKKLMENAGIVRNRLKLNAAVTNARAVLDIQKEFGSFDRFLWQFEYWPPRKILDVVRQVVRARKSRRSTTSKGGKDRIVQPPRLRRRRQHHRPWIPLSSSRAIAVDWPTTV